MNSLIIIGVFGLCYLASRFSEWLLSGNEYILARLGLAAICRTILPLGIFLVLEYTSPFRIRDHAALIFLGYFVLVSLAISRAVQGDQKKQSD